MIDADETRARALARGVLALVLALGSTTSGCALGPTHVDAPAPIVRGPIPGRITSPLDLTWLAFRPRRAATQPPGTWSTTVTSAYSSLYQNGSSGDDRITIDGELWRNAVAARVPVGSRGDLEVELALVYATSGFLDRLIENFHDLALLPGGGREERDDFLYEATIESDGQEIYELDGDRLGLGDLPVVYTHMLVDESVDLPGIALRAGVEFPTGSESHGFGNGAFDFGLGVLGERSFGRWTATGAIDWVSTGSSDGFEDAGVDAADDFDLQLGLEYRWNDELSLLSNVLLSSPPTDDIGLEELDSGVLGLDLGFAYDVSPRSCLMLAFSEDLISAAGADFTVFVAWTLVN